MKRKVAESIQRPAIALGVAGGNVCSVKHVAVPGHPEALIICFSDGKDLLEHACFPPCPHTPIFFQKKPRAHGMMRWVKGIWADRYGRAIASPEGPAPSLDDWKTGTTVCVAESAWVFV